jgi:hypothetical protein
MKNKKDSYYYSAEEWSRSIGYGEVPPERLKPIPEDENKVTTHEKQQEWLKNVRKTKY